MVKVNGSTLVSPENTQKLESAILSEKAAIITCGLLISIFTIPLLVVLQVLSVGVWGTMAVLQMIGGRGFSGKWLFNEANQL